MYARKLLILLISIVVLVTACVSSGSKPPKKRKLSTKNQLGYVLPGYLFSIDAAYDPKIQGMIPGYTAMTVAVVNKGFEQITFRPDTDRWIIKDRDGKQHKAINDIQYAAPAAWDGLHPETRRLIAYPTVVPPGYTQTFQLFFPKEDVDFAGFIYIKHYNATAKKTFTFSRY